MVPHWLEAASASRSTGGAYAHECFEDKIVCQLWGQLCGPFAVVHGLPCKPLTCGDAPWRPPPNPRSATTDQKVRGSSPLGRALFETAARQGRPHRRVQVGLVVSAGQGRGAPTSGCREWPRQAMAERMRQSPVETMVLAVCAWSTTSDSESVVRAGQHDQRHRLDDHSLHHVADAGHRVVRQKRPLGEGSRGASAARPRPSSTARAAARDGVVIGLNDRHSER